MLLPMSPLDSLFLLTESREHPMHVGGLQIFRPPDGATAMDVREQFDDAIASGQVGPLFRKRARRTLTTAGQWGWETDDEFDIEHHVRRNALPQPGRVLELLALCSRLHSTLLDRHRPLWEAHLVEGLDDGRYATYFKVHHALVDGVSALRLLQEGLSEDRNERGMPAYWGLGDQLSPSSVEQTFNVRDFPRAAARSALNVLGDAAGLPGTLVRTVNRGMREQSTSLSFAAPRTMLNVPITGARRFAAQDWPIRRMARIAKSTGATLNDVVLAMCSGALRAYLMSLDALPDVPLVAMVPVSLHAKGGRDGGGNAVGAVMCNLGTDQDDAAGRLTTIKASMSEGKRALAGMSAVQILAMSAIGMSPLLLPMLGLQGVGRPPFNLIISNVPGPRRPMFWNGALLDGLYPLSIPVDGQALNITVNSYADRMGFGLIGCRRSVPHLQRMLAHLDDELGNLEQAAGL